jgi:hypothetical protein
MKFLALSALALIGSLSAAEAPKKEDKHCFVPIFKYRDYKSLESRSQSFLVGAGYHYVQKEGYNVKIDLSLINPQSKVNRSLSFENIYKFSINADTRLFPILGYASDVYGLEETDVKMHYSKKQRVFGGAGLEKSVNGKFLLALTGFLFRDVSDIEYKETATGIIGLKFAKSNGYLVKGSIDFKMDDNIFLRLEPFYRGTFKDIYTEKGAAFSLLYSF